MARFAATHEARDPYPPLRADDDPSRRSGPEPDAPAGADRAAGRFTAAGLLLGLGLGGFVDGIVLHQILQWHHMLTDYGTHDRFPDTTVASLEENTLWDGLFHASTWVFVVVGLFLLWRAMAAGHRVMGRSLVGLLLAGWGLFNLVEGIVDHHILTLHHVRDDVSDPLWWDLGFLAVGVLLIVAGWALHRSGRRSDRHIGAEPPAARLGTR